MTATAVEKDLKVFRVAAISDNANSFGLHQFTFVAEDGTCWQGYGNYIYVREKPVGSELEADMAAILPFGGRFEMQAPMPAVRTGKFKAAKGTAPAAIVKLVWPK